MSLFVWTGIERTGCCAFRHWREIMPENGCACGTGDAEEDDGSFFSLVLQRDELTVAFADDQDIIPDAQRMVAEIDADLVGVITFHDNGADGAAAPAFQTGYIDLNNAYGICAI